MSSGPCLGTDCPECEAARRHYLATGCLHPDCDRSHGKLSPKDAAEMERGKAPKKEPLPIRDPEGPWYINVTHYRDAGRPICSSPVDYAHVEMRENWDEVDCSRCLSERVCPTCRMKNGPWPRGDRGAVGLVSGCEDCGWCY